MYEKFQQKILNCRVVGAHKSFQIFRKNTRFLENNKALSKFLRGILHYIISTIKIKIKSVHKKNNFILTTHTTLRTLAFMQLLTDVK